MTRVVLVDDQAVVRAGFTVILESEGLEVVGEASNGADAVRVARRERPDVVCMDVRMPGGDGITATRELAGPGVVDPVPVLVVSTFDLDDYVFGALQAGAAGFLLKDADPETIFSAIRTVAAGNGLIAPEVTRRLIARFAEVSPVADGSPALDELSAREHEVLMLIARGCSNAEIGESLAVEEATVKKHVSRVLSKLGLRSRVQAVIFAYEIGLVTPGAVRR
ncbi:MAG TPA: response regulator transcription factor [Solirubrobacteraceae bacterium]|nr:response regulator transcription factor [Solirubrobacteraceae bacterium]